LQGQTVYGGYSELAGSQCISVRINGLGNCVFVWEQLTLLALTAFDTLNLTKNDSVLVTLTQKDEPV
jgi:hypothetical protein